VQAHEANLLDFMRKAHQFVIPIFQRPYSWKRPECQRLWDDLIRTGGDEAVPTHFMGSVVYVEEGLNQVTKQSPLLVIDGQQRLTTVSLLIEALARHLGEAEPVSGFSAEKLRARYLMDPLEDGDARYKLLLSPTDRDSLLAITANKPAPASPSERIGENFEFFQERVGSLGEDLSPLCQGLAKLTLVDVSLKRGEDNPQLIFESMNSTGRELGQADLIRNFVLMDLETGPQTDLFEQYWRPMELDFGQEAYGKYFDAFMRHYLTLKTGEIPKVRDVYEAFKDFTKSRAVAELPIAELIADVRTYAGHYCQMALQKEEDAELREVFVDLAELKVDVAYPFLLEVYDDYARGTLSKEDLVATVRLIEAYVFRRSVCAIPTNSLNKTFATAGRALKKDRYLESVKAFFQGLATYKRFPNDAEFTRELKQRDLYNFRSRSYWLRRLENHGRKETVQVGEYTIEHILPQNPDLSAEWQASLGEEWSRVQQEWLHTLGNLTLTGYNSEYSDHSFARKRDSAKGFSHSPLRLNEGLGRVEDWNEEEILKRAARLSELAVSVWAAPNLPAEVLAEYVPTAPAAVAYTIDAHPNLAADRPIRAVFDALRKEILALDEGVTEEFLKLYVAYKAETNFVDIVPQAGRLRISLNMDFPEIYDPRGICLDVTDKGRWGNGNVEVRLDDEEDIPYLMSLVRQSFERQMGEEPVLA
jgi:uncharacterized protein with ParB-like and HNH nuclease domain/predicted transport protein